MTTGIYKLNFIGTDKVYIGQSVHIELRFKQHITNLIVGHSSQKLQEAYNNFGPPKLEILLECTKKDIDSAETEAIGIFNSVNNGFNTLEVALDIPRFTGEEHGRALYSNKQILEAFNILVSNPLISYTKISSITGVSPENLYLIGNGSNHRWLEEQYPHEYKIMLSHVGTRKATCQSASNRGVVYPNIISPDGKVYSVENIRGFAITHGLDQAHLGQVLRFKAKTHKGWKLA
jgi:group I intron endonuclease